MLVNRRCYLVFHELFLQTTQKVFSVIFLNPRTESQILTPHPFPPLRKFFIECIEQGTKTFYKKKTVDRAGQKPVDRHRF